MLFVAATAQWITAADLTWAYSFVNLIALPNGCVMTQMCEYGCWTMLAFVTSHVLSQCCLTIPLQQQFLHVLPLLFIFNDGFKYCIRGEADDPVLLKARAVAFEQNTWEGEQHRVLRAAQTDASQGLRRPPVDHPRKKSFSPPKLRPCASDCDDNVRGRILTPCGTL